MALLLDADYERLREAGLSFEEDEERRFLVFTSVQLEKDLYTAETCDVLVVVPPNYPQAGNDMFWTDPPLRRRDGAAVPMMMEPGGSDNRMWKGREFCRWSRHWNPPLPGVWRPGRDDVASIYRRVEWALRYPDCQ